MKLRVDVLSGRLGSGGHNGCTSTCAGPGSRWALIKDSLRERGRKWDPVRRDSLRRRRLRGQSRWDSSLIGRCLPSARARAFPRDGIGTHRLLFALQLGLRLQLRRLALALWLWGLRLPSWTVDFACLRRGLRLLERGGERRSRGIWHGDRCAEKAEGEFQAIYRLLSGLRVPISASHRTSHANPPGQALTAQSGRMARGMYTCSPHVTGMHHADGGGECP